MGLIRSARGRSYPNPGDERLQRKDNCSRVPDEMVLINVIKKLQWLTGIYVEFQDFR